MPNVWLKLIGTTEERCPEPYKLDSADFTRMPRQMRCGDYMVLYAVGGRKRVFALAEVASEVRASGVKRWPYRVTIRYLVNLPPSLGVHIDEITTGKRDILRVIRRGVSYFKLHPEEYALAASKLREADNTK
jgi:hypothetical protein